MGEGEQEGKSIDEDIENLFLYRASGKVEETMLEFKKISGVPVKVGRSLVLRWEKVVRKDTENPLLYSITQSKKDEGRI